MPETPTTIDRDLSFQLPTQTISAGEVHLWKLPLEIERNRLGKLAAFLSSDETAKAGRYQSEVHRNRFIAGRGMLRMILGHYCDLHPAEVRFDYSPNGKPTLKWADATCSPEYEVHFNLAHSQGLGVLAVTRVGPVGVDIEQVREFPELSELVGHFFSTREATEFSTLPREKQTAAFFTLWTRKEALLKAIGEGIGESLNRVEVTFLPGAPPEVLSLPAALSAGREWSLVNLAIAPSYVGALALPVCNASVHRNLYAKTPV